jgi:hypothetical protein
VGQINLNVTPAFEAALGRLMRLRGLRTKSEAIREAVAEAAERARCAAPVQDFSDWIGAATLAPLNPSPRFVDHDELWR